MHRLVGKYDAESEQETIKDVIDRVSLYLIRYYTPEGHDRE